MGGLYPDIKGKIFLFDMNQPEEAPREIRITGKEIDAESILPHGMDIWESGPNGVSFLAFTRAVSSFRCSHVLLGL